MAESRKRFERLEPQLRREIMIPSFLFRYSVPNIPPKELEDMIEVASNPIVTAGT